MTSNTDSSKDDSDSSAFEYVDTGSKSGVLNESDKAQLKFNDSSNVEKIKFSTLLCLKRGDKKAIVDWCMKMGLIPSAYFCVKCSKSMKLIEKRDLSDGYAWCCRVRGVNGHKSSRTVRTGSWFSKSKMDLCEMLMLIHCWVYQLPLEWVLLEVGCSQTTVYEWFNNCREICVYYIDSMTSIGGANKTVEIDETKLNCKTSRGKNSEVVIGGIEKESTRCFFEGLEEQSIGSLLEVIERNILPRTNVILHCWNSYDCFNNKNFVELAASGKYSFKKPTMGSSGTFQNVWWDLKHFVPASMDKFEPFLAEYAWRKNNCDSYDKMKSFIEAIKVLYPLRTSDAL